MEDNGSTVGGALGWCYWDYPIVPISLYVVVGLLAHIPIFRCWIAAMHENILLGSTLTPGGSLSARCNL
jgi:hypothetical protein